MGKSWKVSGRFVEDSKGFPFSSMLKIQRSRWNFHGSVATAHSYPIPRSDIAVLGVVDKMISGAKD